MCTMAINQQFNGIELTFAEKPAEETRDAMKALGFRWHRQKKLWYAKQTTDRLALARRLSADTAVTKNPPLAAAPSDQVVSKYGIKAGDIISAVWGYSMTIVTYYKVKKIISPCKVEIVEIGKKIVSTDRGGGERVLPDPENELNRPITKMVVKDGNRREWHIKINSSVSLTAWDGQPDYQNTYD